ncbi:GGDEF domain-containing protein [Streptomyces syringium]|uniref:GGDEF domain-containing protein n=1 Tax=Streptomyces syringium TaxID=76729 RepID=UPI00340EC43D
MNLILQALPIAAPSIGWAVHACFLVRRLRSARRDPLTGLMCREEFTTRSQRALRHPQAAVLLLDLNGFKQINDTHGHAVGDQVLAAVAKRLNAWCQARGGFAARLGGDEFTAMVRLAPDADVDAEMTYNLSAALSAPLDTGGVTLSPRASIGVCRTADRPGAGLSDLLRGADEAMYTAKRLGRHWQPAGPADVYATTNGRRAGRPGTHLTLLAPTARRTAS